MTRRPLILALLPLLVAATCDGPRQPAPEPVRVEGAGGTRPVLTEPPRIWVLVDRRTPEGQSPNPVLFWDRGVHTLYVRMSSGREVALVTPPEALVTADLARLDGRTALHQLTASAGQVVGPFRGTIPTNAVMGYDRYLESDGVRRLVLLLDVDEEPETSMELEAMATIDTAMSADRSGSAEFVPLAYVFGAPSEAANAPAPAAPAELAPPPPCPLGPHWLAEGAEWRLEPPLVFEIDSTELTPASLAVLQPALEELAPATRVTAFVDVHPSVAARYAERSMNLPRRRAQALAERLGAGATGEVRVVATERPTGPPTLRFALDCAD